MSARPCGTCQKSVYPKEKISISDVWLHRACLKCSVCSTTLSLNSVYVSVAEGSKKIYCKVDVPRAIHTAIVDSIALRRAISAPRPSLASSTSAQLPGNGGKGSMRFKGLTLRSKGMKGGMEAQERRGGVDMGFGRVVVGNARGSTLDSWDIQNAIQAQHQASSPLHSHPALTAQLTGSQPGHFLSPSILSPQLTGREDQQPSWIRSDTAEGERGADAAEGEEDDGIAREKKGVKEVVNVEKDLVKNLLRAFQLDTLSIVELPPLGPNPTHQPPSPSSNSSHSLATPSTLTLANTAANAQHPAPPSAVSSFGGLMAPPPTPVAKRLGGGGDAGPGGDMFASIKLPGGTLGTLGHARMDVLNVVGTLGTRKGFSSTAAKPGLRGLFDPPCLPGADGLAKTQRAKSVRIASGKPSIIEMFAGKGQSVALPDSDDEEEEEEEEEEMSEEIGDEEFARRMEKQGLEVTLIYEEVVEPGVVEE